MHSLVGWAKALARRFPTARTRVRRAHHGWCGLHRFRWWARRTIGLATRKGHASAFAHPTIPSKRQARTLLRRTGPRVRRDRDARARTIDPTDADAFRGRPRRKRIGAQAIVADFVEVIAQRQDSDGPVDEPALPIPIRRAVDLADDLMRRNGFPARVSDRVAAVIRPGRAAGQHGSGNDDSKEISSHAGPVGRRSGAASRCCLDPAAHNVKIARRYNRAIREDAMGTQDRGDKGGAAEALSRRSFLSKGAAAGVGAAALTGAAATEARAEIKWDHTADIVIIGAGVAGLAAAITARDHSASVIAVEENYDIGGRGILSGGRLHLGGGNAIQQRHGIKDTPDQVYADWVRFDAGSSRYSDRDLVRVFADENLATYDFLVENGVEFIDKMIGPEAASTVPRTFVTVEWHVPSELIAPGRNRNGSGLVRRLEASARKKGAQIFLRHKMTKIIREQENSRRVIGIAAMNGSNPVNIQARKGVIIATGGHTGNVNFR